MEWVSTPSLDRACKQIVGRIKDNKNAIIVFNGPTGSGKTWATISLAYRLMQLLKTNFTPKENITFNVVDMIDQTELPQNKPKGTGFIFEEIGAIGSGGASSEWQSVGNRGFDSLLQTIRSENQVFIFTCPLFTNLSSKARSYVHIKFDMKRINLGKKRSYAKMLNLHPSSGVKAKIYMKYTRYTDQGKRYRLKEVEFPIPPPEIVEEYEGMKNRFVSDLKQTIKEQAAPKKGKNESMLDTIRNLSHKGANNETISKIVGWNEIKVKNFKETNKIHQIGKMEGGIL